MKYTDEDITRAMNKILECDVFSSSPRSQDFFKYIVTETLEGREELLNGTIIAQDVFNKGADFDSGVDSIVRVHARRVRSMLRDYYIEYPARDPVVLTIPKGGYRIVVKPNKAYGNQVSQSGAGSLTPPRFKAFKRPVLILALLAVILALYIGISTYSKSSSNAPSQAELEPIQSRLNQENNSVSDYPLIAVRPFVNQTGEKDYDFLEDSLQSMLVHDLSRFQLVRPVIYDEVYETLPKDGEVNQGPYRYAISGKILSVVPELNLSIKLVDLDDGSILSEKEIRRSSETSEYLNDLSKIVTDLSGEFAGLWGVIPQENLNHIEAQISRGTMSLSDINQYECLTLTDNFQYDPQKTPAKFKAVYTCLDAYLQDNPDDPLLLAYFGSLTVWATKSDPKFHMARSLNPDIKSEDGFKMVKRALEIVPDIGNVQYLYSSTLMTNGGSIDEVLKHAELACKANPGNPLYMAWVSHLLVDVGDWGRALSLAKEARDRTPSQSGGFYLPDFAWALRYDDKEGMKKMASLLAEGGAPYSYIYEYLAAAANDDEPGMAKHRAKIDRVDARQKERGLDGIMFVLMIKIRNPEVLSKARDLFIKEGVIANQN